MPDYSDLYKQQYELLESEDKKLKSKYLKCNEKGRDKTVT
jgi:hypothetical protein